MLNNKYSKNFKKHRNFIFLSNKILFNKLDYSETNFVHNNDNSYILNFFKFKKQIFKNKKNYPLNNHSSFDNFSNTDENLFNNDKFLEFLNILKHANKINYIFFVNILSTFFRYSYFLRFIFESFIIFSFIIYSFKSGTFY
jgi:hypothetical protein